MLENNSFYSVENAVKFDEKFIIKLTNENVIERNAKQRCKILQFSSELDIDQVLEIIKTLKPSEYPKTFIYIIENQNDSSMIDNFGDKMKQIDDGLCKFSEKRPLILLYTFGNRSEFRFYYKSRLSTSTINIDQKFVEDFKLYEEYKKYMKVFSKRDLEQFEDTILKKLSCTKDSSIVLRFLSTLNLEKEFFRAIVLKVAKTGSKADLLAVIHPSFDESENYLNNQGQNYIKKVFKNDKFIEDLDKSEEKEVSSSSPNKNQNDSLNNSQSVLLTAIYHSNQEIIDYLITFCTPLIQQLPFNHQIKVSATAFENSQYDVLCDLLEFSDFPFPDDFNILLYQINHERFQKTIKDRIKFHEGIKKENYEEVNKFIKNNLNLKFVYNLQNQTAMKYAITLQKYKIYYYLKSYGFSAIEFNDLEDHLNNKNEFRMAKAQQNVQIKELICEALRDENKTVSILCTKSLIHNRKVTKDDEAKYRQHIKQWFKDIYKVAQTMLDVAATCDDLKIIFDFESKFVDRTAFKDDFFGIAFNTVTSRIFIGAELGNAKRIQNIKGTLAHELCHYVMSLIYDNGFLPYYDYSKELCDIFNEIVKSIDKWSANQSESIDDECNQTISSVFTSYPEDCYHYELIVRVVHILVLYDDNPNYSNYLQTKYQMLFDFWFNHVVPEMEKYLQKNKVAIRINRTVGLQRNLSNSEIEFFALKYVEHLIANKITIITTNVPMLLFINIYKHFQEKCGSLLDSENIFIDLEKVRNKQVRKDLKYLKNKDVKLNVFVDCTKNHLDQLCKILQNLKINIIIVASNEDESAKLKEICKSKRKINQFNEEINYSWNELNEQTQLMLLKTKVTFQNDPEISLLEVLSKTTNPDQNEIKEILHDFANVINDQLFNLLVEQQKICINSCIDNDKNFKFLFQKRNFINKKVNFKTEISQEKLISTNADNKYVLISDIAGSGKSCVVKNILNIIKSQKPSRWVTYVDLKDFIEEFRDEFNDLEFTSYFIKNILKPKSEFEAKIFEKLYKSGKVSIVFDGFDEIAPSCAEFVAKFAEKFEYNEGNQLWIVTRDYFEITLQKKFNIDNVYKLEEFTEEEGINYIVASWILTDIKDQIITDIEDYLLNSQNKAKYVERAKKIVQNVAKSENHSVGLPLIFSLIANEFKNDKSIDDIKGNKIFTRFVNKMYTRWADHKGDFRKEASVQSQHYEFSFMKFHQYCAIISVFPELKELFFPDYDQSEWPETEIIACGLMYKIGSFIHETFREFFIADFIYKAIKKTKVKPEVIDLLIQVLTVQKYGIIRMFINGFIDNKSSMEKIQLEMVKSISKIYNTENFSEFFTENQEQLAECVIEILKKGDYENVKKILINNIQNVATKTKGLTMFSKFIEFLFSFLKEDDLKDVINDKIVLQKISGSGLDIEIFEHFIKMIVEKIGQEFLLQQLKLMPPGSENGNVIYHFATSQNLNREKVRKLLEIIQRYLVESEIIELMDNCNTERHTILKVLVIWTENFKPFFDGAEIFFKSKNFITQLKKIAYKNDSHGQHVLHWSAFKDGIEFHSSVWDLVKKIFENPKELKSFAFQKSKLASNFLHNHIVRNSSETIEFIIQKCKEVFDESDYEELLRSKALLGRNLLQMAMVYSKDIKTHQILWEKIRATCKSDEEFLEIIEECDQEGNNILNLASSFTTCEILEFMQEWISKIATPDKIRKIVKKLGFGKRNFLQAAAVQNKTLKLHEALWKILQTHFSLSEAFEFIKNCDIYGENLLINVVLSDTKDLADLTWKAVKNMIASHKLFIIENEENMERCDKIIKNISTPSQLFADEKEILKLNWIKNTESIDSNFFEHSNQSIIEIKTSITKLENLNAFISNENLENHIKLWKHFKEFYKNGEDLKKLLLEKDEFSHNFVHLVISHNTPDVIKFTLEMLKENFNEADYQEIIRSKGRFNRNFLQIAMRSSKQIETHQILWKTFQSSCKSNQEFLEILNERDQNNNNVFNIAAIFSTHEILKFIQSELEKLERHEVKNLLKNLGEGNKNILSAAARQNKSLKHNVKIWEIIESYFDPSDILQFIKHCDSYGLNLLMNVLRKNTEEIKELTWNMVKKTIEIIGLDNDNLNLCEHVMKSDKNLNELSIEEIRILKLEWIKDTNSEKLFMDSNQLILQNASSVKSVKDLELFIADEKVINHKVLWEHLIESFKNYEDLKQLLFEKNTNQNNFIHQIVIFNKADVIEFTIQKLKEHLKESDYHEILRSKGQIGRNMLHVAAVRSKEVKTYEVLWKEFRDSCKSNEEFLNILEEADDVDRKVITTIASIAGSDVFEFMFSELEKLKNYKEIRKFLSSFGNSKVNLIQYLAINNRNIETHKSAWKIIYNYFDTKEILEVVNQDANLLYRTAYGNTKEIAEFTWNQIKIIIKTKAEQIEYLNKKGKNEKSLYQVSLENKKYNPQLTDWVQQTLNEYGIKFLE